MEIEKEAAESGTDKKISEKLDAACSGGSAVHGVDIDLDAFGAYGTICFRRFRK